MKRRPPLPCLSCGGPKPLGRGKKYCPTCVEESCRQQVIARRNDNLQPEQLKHRREYWRNRELRRRYGITRADYDAMVEQQSGRCAICKRVPVANNRINNFAVDHDHKTGKVRGLLCQRCNMAMAFLDNAEWLSAASEYLVCPDSVLNHAVAKDAEV